MSNQQSHCSYCGKNETSSLFKSCSSCLTVKYCSKNCQLRHWKEHNVICKAINELSTKEYIEYTAKNINSIYPTHIKPDQRVSIAKLVGEKCTIQFELENVKMNGLWDTGAQVSIISRATLLKNFPTKQVKDMRDLLGIDEDLKIVAANGTNIPYEGWVELKMELPGDMQKNVIVVPFLVTKETLDLPIIGFNVICELSRAEEGNSEAENQTVFDQFQRCFQSLKGEEIYTLVNLIKSCTQNEILCDLKTPKKDWIIQKGETASVPCRARTGPITRRTPAIFEPDVAGNFSQGLQITEELVTLKQGTTQIVHINVTNISDHDIRLRNRTVLGNLQLVQSVTPAEVEQIDDLRSDHSQQKGDRVKSGDQNSDADVSNMKEMENKATLPKVNLEALTKEQKNEVERMLLEEANSFSRDGDDIGVAKGLNWK